MSERLIDLVHAYQGAKALHARHRFAEELVLEIFPPLKAFILRKCPVDSAEDVSQETLLAITKGLDSFRGRTESELWGWAYKIAVHKVADHFRDATKHEALPLDGKEILRVIEALAADEPLPSAERLNHEEIVKMLDQLKPRSRALLWERFILDWDLATIAKEHHLTYDAARMAVRRSLEEAAKLQNEV